MSAVNQAMWDELTALSVGPDTAPWAGISRAVGVGPGESGDEATHPVYAFYVSHIVTAPAEQAGLVVFLATPGRLVRYEWSPTAASSTTVPLDRVAAIEEVEEGNTFSVTLHADTPVRFALQQTQVLTGEDGAVTHTTNERSESLMYRLTVGPETAHLLAEFSRRLRLLTGV